MVSWQMERNVALLLLHGEVLWPSEDGTSSRTTSDEPEIQVVEKVSNVEMASVVGSCRCIHVKIGRVLEATKKTNRTSMAIEHL